MKRTTLARLRNSRLIASLIGLAGCSAALMLAARLVRQIMQIVAAGGAQQLAVLWPKLALIGLLAGFAAMAGFAVLVYGTGGLTPWHEAAGTAADAIRQNGSSPIPDAMDPRQRMEAGEPPPVQRDDPEGLSAVESAQPEATSDAGENVMAETGEEALPADASTATTNAPAPNTAAAADDVPEGHVRCAACGAVNSDLVPFCAACGEDITLS